MSGKNRQEMPPTRPLDDAISPPHAGAGAPSVTSDAPVKRDSRGADGSRGRPTKAEGDPIARAATAVHRQ
jgi:hypothetical protein